MEINLKNICAVNKYAASTEETRYYLNGVFIHTDTEWAYAVATDGHRMIVHRFPNADGSNFKFIIPRVFLSSFKFSARDNGKAQMFHSDGIIMICRDDGDRSVKEVDGTFPDYTRVRPRNDGDLLPTVFNGQYLADFDAFAKAMGTHAIVNPRGAEPALVTFGRTDIYGALMPIPSQAEKRPFATRAPF